MIRKINVNPNQAPGHEPGANIQISLVFFSYLEAGLGLFLGRLDGSDDLEIAFRKLEIDRIHQALIWPQVIGLGLLLGRGVQKKSDLKEPGQASEVRNRNRNSHHPFGIKRLGFELHEGIQAVINRFRPAIPYVAGEMKAVGLAGRYFLPQGPAFLLAGSYDQILFPDDFPLIILNNQASG